MSVVQASSLIGHELVDIVGTLGCLVRKRGAPGDLYILSASHVLSGNGYGSRGDAIIQYSLATQSWTPLARLTDYAKFAGGVDGLHAFDAAYARIDDGQEVDPAIPGIGLPRGVTLPYRGMQVRLCGAKSGYVTGQIESYGEPAEVTYNNLDRQSTFGLKFRNQIRYGKLDSSLRSISPITIAGDSGALVLDAQGYAVGLHIAVSSDGLASICSPLIEILEHFELELITAATQAATSASPSAAAPVAPAAPNVTTNYQDRLDNIGERSIAELGESIRGLFEPQSVGASIKWWLSDNGLVVDGKLPRTAGRLVTVPRVWKLYGDLIASAAAQHHVPAELIVATMCTESNGNADRVRYEESDRAKAVVNGMVSGGLMQTLLRTTREIMGDPTIALDRLLDPEYSIEVGSRYIANQRRSTFLDPPRVACSYNAGSIKLNASPSNRWQMLQYPEGTGEHADRFVQWFNDCFAYFRSERNAPPTSFVALID